MKYIERIAYVLLLIAVLIAFQQLAIARYIASFGAAGIAVVRLKEQYNGDNLRMKRLMRLRHLIGIGYVVAAGLMFREQNYWLVAFFISVMLELYTMIVISHIEERSSSKQNTNNKNNTKK